MYKLASLKDNHYYGCLMQEPLTNSMLCLSGWNSKKVEKYFNNDSHVLNDNNTSDNSNTKNITLHKKNTWVELVGLSFERSEASYIIINVGNDKQNDITKIEET